MKSFIVYISSILLFSTFQTQASSIQIVTIPSASELVEVRLMVKAGSAHDPKGKEGLAELTAQALLEGGFGDSKNPTTKEKLADITLPWGDEAAPSYSVDKETSTFSMVIPKAVLKDYISQVLKPLFTQPLFLDLEVTRIKNETASFITSSFRYADNQRLGLDAIDNFIGDGTSYAHAEIGSVQSLKTITTLDVQKFYKTYYLPNNLILGMDTKDSSIISQVSNALLTIGSNPKDIHPFTPAKLQAYQKIQGRELAIIAAKGLTSTGIHAAFPLSITRKDPNYWPLYVANVYLGTHRDSFGILYKKIREKRGYNYGDYSYMEHFAGRSYFLFPPFNIPRTQQYFSLWIRPLDSHKYVHHILKAMLYLYDDFIQKGLSPEQVASTKEKAKIIYLNLNENSSRLLASKMDDAFYGMSKGYLDQYLSAIDSVTAKQVNSAIKKYLQSQNMKLLIVTSPEMAEKLKNDITANQNAEGKTAKDYKFEVLKTDPVKGESYSDEAMAILEEDKKWSAYPLNLKPEQIHVYPVESIFETDRFTSAAK